MCYSVSLHVKLKHIFIVQAEQEELVKHRNLFKLLFNIFAQLLNDSVRFACCCHNRYFVFVAGNTGVAVTLYDSRKSSVSRIEKEAGIKFEHLAAPQPDEIARSGGMEAAEKVKQVCDRYADTCISRFFKSIINNLECRIFT